MTKSSQAWGRWAQGTTPWSLTWGYSVSQQRPIWLTHWVALAE